MTAVITLRRPLPAPSIDALVASVALDMHRVDAMIRARTQSRVGRIPEIANYLIASGGKRLRPMLTIAMCRLAGYAGDNPPALGAGCVLDQPAHPS